MKRIEFCSAALCACLIAAQAQGAFIVEARSGGKAFANLSFGPGTSPVSNSTVGSAAVGTTAGIGSIFGGAAVAPIPDTYIFSYTPGTDVDNTTFTTGQVLGSKTNFPGQGNLSTGLTGGPSGIYNVYFTTPETSNINGGGSDFTVTQDGAPIVLNDVDLNNGGLFNAGTGPDTDPGTAFVGGANNAWFKLGSVTLTAGNTYSVSQAANSNTFTSQRAHGVMWEYVGPVPEPATAPLAAIGLLGIIAARRRA